MVGITEASSSCMPVAGRTHAPAPQGGDTPLVPAMTALVRVVRAVL